MKETSPLIPAFSYEEKGLMSSPLMGEDSGEGETFLSRLC